jgi:hypothetical protein
LDIIPINSLDSSSLKTSYWLTGYSDADASFQIKILKRLNKKNPEIIPAPWWCGHCPAVGRVIPAPWWCGYCPAVGRVILYFQIDSKYSIILNQIKEDFNGFIGLRKSQNTYYYHSTSFNSAKIFIKYFDKYSLQSIKYLNYIKWRKAYLIIQDEGHLTKLGQNKIRVLKNSMNRNLEIKIKSNINDN